MSAKLLLEEKFLRFLAVGVLNTGFSFLFYAVLAGLLQVQYLLALVIVWVTSLILTYSLNLVWSFRSAPVLTYDKRFVRYSIVYISGFFLNAGLLALAVDGLEFDAILAQAGALPFVIGLNYVAMSCWALKT